MAYRRITIKEDQDFILEEMGDFIINKFNKNIRRIPPPKLPNSNFVETKCWFWMGSQDGLGYGIFNYRYVDKRVKITERTHRLSYIIYNGEKLPKGAHVIHKCDNTLCCNPDHLRMGNNRKNSQDKVNRLYTPKPFSKVYKLSRYHKHAIRILWNHSNFTSIILADMFNVSPATIHDIINKRTGYFTDDIGIENPDPISRCKPWSKKDINILKKFMENRDPYDKLGDIAAKLNRTRSGLRGMMYRIQKGITK